MTGSQYPLAEMSNQCKPSLEALEFPVPEPLEPFDERARQLFPWLSFLNSSGPFTIQYPLLSSIEYNIRHCLAGLRPVDKLVIIVLEIIITILRNAPHFYFDFK